MKNGQVDRYAAKDICAQVDKVLRGLGNPDPPLDLRVVRDLLELDLQYYSSSNDGLLQEMVSRVRVGAKQVAKRPSLLLDVVRKANLQALWLPDHKRILIDEGVKPLKRRHTEAHEILHSITPHHKIYLFGDDCETLRPSFYEALEGEANYGASQLLFMRERFIAMYRDMPTRFATVRKLSETFGNTLTMTLWRLVEDAPDDEPVFGVVSTHPWKTPDDFDETDPCRHFIESAAFRRKFGNVTEVSAFEAIRTYATAARGGPLGDGSVVFTARDGTPHSFHMETFYNGHDALTLGAYEAPVGMSVVVL